MNELVTQSILEENLAFLAEFPDDLLNEEELEVKEFALKYLSSHGVIPTLKILAGSTPFIPYYFEPSEWEPRAEPLSAVYARALKGKLLEKMEMLVLEALNVIRHEAEIPDDIFIEIMRIKTLATGVEDWATFDRKKYWRTKSIDFPFKILNTAMGGIADGDFMVIAGRLGTGKSTIAQYLAKVFAIDRSLKVLFVSSEMTSVAVFGRLDAMVGRFNPLKLRDLRDGEEAEGEKFFRDVLGAVITTVGEADGSIIIPKSRLQTPQSIASFAKNLLVDIIVIDGAYLLAPSDGMRHGSKWEIVGAISNELRDIALELRIPIIGTVQIKRGASRGDKGWYDTESLALSDELGRDAAFVLTVDPNEVVKGRLELALIKNRFGPEVATQVMIDYDKMEIVDESVEGESMAGISAERAATLKKKIEEAAATVSAGFWSGTKLTDAEKLKELREKEAIVDAITDAAVRVEDEPIGSKEWSVEDVDKIW